MKKKNKLNGHKVTSITVDTVEGPPKYIVPHPWQTKCLMEKYGDEWITKEEVHMKIAEIFLEREVVYGKKKVRIVRWENVLPFKKLPDEYTLGYPSFYLKENHIFVYCSPTEFYRLYEGGLINIEYWSRLYNKEKTGYLQKAGNRLSRILKGEDWVGAFRVEI